jgi:hypothetical protein
MLLAAGKLDARGQTVAKLVYWLPLIQMIFGQYHIPGPALIPPAFAVFLLVRLAQRDRGREFTQGEPAVTTALPVSR